MSQRQYGIPSGYVHGASTQQTRTPESPAEALGYAGRPGHDAQALRDVDNMYNPRMNSPSPDPYSGHYDITPPPPPHHSAPSPLHQHSSSSLTPLTANNQGAPYSSPPRSPERSQRRNVPPMAAAAGAGLGATAAGYEGQMPRGSYYHGDGYDHFDPGSIADDGDDGLEEAPRQRRSRLNLAAAAGFGSGAAAGAGAGAAKSFGARDASGNYGPVGQDPEKSEWLTKQSGGNKRLKWIVGGVLAFLIVGGIVGGVVGGILASKNGGSGGSSGSSGGSGSHSGGLYDIHSKEVQAVLNNDQLHKVFPTIDYTPRYAQYPQCLSPGGGPVQNNVTLDVARLSQLTPAIRLYGTDCNQTELVLEAIDRLEMQDSMKVWLGVYLDGNQTTNDRQMSHLYEILDKYDHSSFVGVIVGNEVLYAKTWTITQLQTQLEGIRQNFTSKGINLPVSTADLGDNWDANLAQASDIVMANIHPFFAGTVAEEAASWAYTFWQGKDIPLKTAKTDTTGSLTYPTQIISEIGWPSQGGNDCGDANDPAYGCTSETDGAVASIDNLNTFMDGWVCDALNNGTTFFWFEAFDEEWKHQFDTEHNKWESAWGLFDSDRNLKDGMDTLLKLHLENADFR
ncbi:putative glucan endo-1,3-beta-glucosidase btgC [Pseudocercospora fuligena]|uniref:glucan endo-1,3-beta-D-glucosidase n=1 Tax=Pseudocercospora fuligena TaxID=685502 RepID=A0A8H6VE17_9PEZI|nr:putative glucan endo-1,3-beta-glucosidase btgC [Pseudocercospora fuligena]